MKCSCSWEIFKCFAILILSLATSESLEYGIFLKAGGHKLQCALGVRPGIFGT